MPSIVFDHTHLTLATAGNSGLLLEILETFIDSSRQIVTDLAMTQTLEQWRDGVHRLKGAARSVGAVALADIAALAELEPPEPAVWTYWTERLRMEVDRFDAHVLGTSPGASPLLTTDAAS
jgi:HPt (histidine-containing phosphotransfer) domain-containing protein